VRERVLATGPPRSAIPRGEQPTDSLGHRPLPRAIALGRGKTLGPPSAPQTWKSLTYQVVECRAGAALAQGPPGGTLG
jgi:hypothetical protein